MFCPTCGRESGTSGAPTCAACGAAIPDGFGERHQRSLFRGTLWALVVVLGLVWFVRIVVGRLGPDDLTPFPTVLTWIGLFTVVLTFILARRRRTRARLAAAKPNQETRLQ